MSHQSADASALGEPGGKNASRRGTSLVTTLAKIVGGLIVVGLLFYFGRQATPYVKQFTSWVDSLGVWAPVVFILGYIVATVGFVPGSILTLAAGAIFGLLWGTVYVFIGSSIGACLAFLISRYLARGWVEAKLEGQPKFRAIDRAVGRDGGKIVALMRLAPVFPFNLLNYALGLTNVRFWHYALACIAMIPGTLLYVYYGYLAGSLAQATGGGQRQRTIWDWVILGVGLVAVVAVTWIITRKAKQALDEQTDIEVDGTEVDSVEDDEVQEGTSDE